MIQFEEKSDKELKELTLEITNVFERSKMKPSQVLEVVWTCVKIYYGAWVHFGGKLENALADMRNSYEDAKADVIKESQKR